MALFRKSDFAKRCNVDKSRVSQWLTAGRISGAAIVGEGQRALLDNELACAQLRERLAVNERFGLNDVKERAAIRSVSYEAAGRSGALGRAKACR